MGFKVTRDYVNDNDKEIGTVSAVPSNPFQWHMGASEEDYLYKEGKIKVRLLDEDGNVYFHGLVDDTVFSAELFLDWGMRYAGATNLDLSMDDWKKERGEEEHPYPSKDGKWVSLIG
ncbi:hypothetical protein [Bacillus safensis]|uniref:Uncharacterized protein n=1 Tax=Bacillus safensis TaxID=561879 RepID=A0A1L6ZPA1_BACIA|nr:hypothetical protein [Bacillus safensis]APT48335.1 hypothetical protein BSA145_20950 [Bacillus safensis]